MKFRLSGTVIVHRKECDSVVFDIGYITLILTVGIIHIWNLMETRNGTKKKSCQLDHIVQKIFHVAIAGRSGLLHPYLKSLAQRLDQSH